MSKLLCLYRKYVCIWVYTCVYIYTYIDGLVWGGRGSGALAVEMRLSCTNPRKFTSVYRTSLCAVWEGRRHIADALGLRFSCTSPSMWSNIRTEDGHSTCNPAFFVMMSMWPISLVWKTDTNVQYATVVSPPEQIHAYMENPQPRIRAVPVELTCAPRRSIEMRFYWSARKCI